MAQADGSALPKIASLDVKNKQKRVQKQYWQQFHECGVGGWRDWGARAAIKLGEEGCPERELQETDQAPKIPSSTVE